MMGGDDAPPSATPTPEPQADVDPAEKKKKEDALIEQAQQIRVSMRLT